MKMKPLLGLKNMYILPGSNVPDTLGHNLPIASPLHQTTSEL